MNNHKYGFDYEEDVKNLYGKNHKLLNDKRIRLFEEFNPSVPEVKALRNIIQNPMPITTEQFNEWSSIKNKLLKSCGYYLSENDKNILSDINNFVYVYHVIGI